MDPDTSASLPQKTSPDPDPATSVTSLSNPARLAVQLLKHSRKLHCLIAATDAITEQLLANVMPNPTPVASPTIPTQPTALQAMAFG